MLPFHKSETFRVKNSFVVDPKDEFVHREPSYEAVSGRRTEKLYMMSSIGEKQLLRDMVGQITNALRRSRFVMIRAIGKGN